MSIPESHSRARLLVWFMVVGLTVGGCECGGNGGGSNPTDPPIPTPPGSVRISVVSTGDDIPATYILTVTSSDGNLSDSRTIPANGTRDFPNIPAGVTVTGTLSEIPENCMTPQATKTAASVSNQVVQVEFAATCQALVGAIAVTASTDGAEEFLDDDGYTVTVGTGDAALAINGTVTFADLPVGSYEVTVSGVDDDCNLGGDNPHSVAVTFQGTAQVEYKVACPMLYFDDFSVGDQWDTLSIFVNPGSGHSESNPATGGVDDTGYRRMNHVIQGPGGLWVWHRFSGGSYDPAAEGAVTMIDYSEAHRKIIPNNQTSQIGAHIGIEQDGHVYRVGFPPINGYRTTVWTEETLDDLTQNDFILAPGAAAGAPTRPDFSEDGAEIFLGFIRANSTPGTGVGNLTHGIDNWRLVVYRTPLGG